MKKKNSTRKGGRKASKSNSKPNKTSSTTTTSNTIDDVPVLHSTIDVAPQFLTNPTPSYVASSSIDLSDNADHIVSSPSDSYTIQPLQNISSLSSSACGTCYLQTTLFNIAGYCTNCGIPICWSCWSSDTSYIYCCSNCRLLNCAT